MRIRRRHLVVLAVAAIGALAAAGAALALTNNSSSANFSFSPSTVPKKSFKSGKILVHTHTDFAKPADKAKGGFIKRVQVYFDNDFKFNTGAAPICKKNLANTNEAQAMSLCGKALVGTGKAQATSTANANIPGCVLAFNGPKNGSGKPTLILHSRFIMANCSNPASNSGGTVDAILTGALKPANKSGFGKVLDVNNIDTQPLPLKDFTVTVKKGSYIQVRCPKSPWKVQTKFTYSGSGQAPDTVNAKEPCTAG
jgi:hypothetical protein